MGELGSPDILEFGRFRFDRRGRCLYRLDRAGDPVVLPAGRTALDILGLLVERAGEVVESEEIRRTVWRGKTVEDANLATQIFHLRESVGRSRIQTVSGRGYRFVGPVRRLNGNAGAVLPTRRLAAILAADVVGYSRLMGADEEGTLERLKALRRELIDQKIEQHQGRIVKTTGDGLLVEFASVLNAVRCAAEVQRGMMDREPGLLDEQRIKLRIGINLGDVIADDDDIFGDGVNVAARLEALAEPGGICVSGVVRDQVRDKLPYSLEDCGEQSVKNIARPVRVYALRPAAIAELPPSRLPPGMSIPPPAVSPRLSIVVLPFADLSEDVTRQYFVDGVTEDLTTDLSRLPDLFVISRSTAFVYRGQPVDTRQIGSELGVRYVLEGSVRRAGTRVRINAQLIDAETGAHLWSERFDRELGDLFTLQDEITSGIVGAIEPQLLKFERDRVASRPQHSENAYEFYQRGMWHLYKYCKADSIEAQGCFRRALTIDSGYPHATAFLAIALCSAAYLGWVKNAEHNYLEAYDLAKRAVSLDARYPAAHFALGLVCMYTRRSDRAMAALREAINLNPSYAGAHVLLGWMYLYRGQPEEALGLAERGICLSPRDPLLFMWLPALAGVHYQLRRYDEAVEIGRRSWNLNRNWPAGLRYVVAGLAQLGRTNEARDALEDLRQLDTDLAFVESLALRLYADSGSVDHILDGLRKAGLE
jgi:adenylate cyclase